MDLFIARQPIFDEQWNVVAYEVLYRSGFTDVYDGTDDRNSTAKVINAVFYSHDSERIVNGKRAFINFPQSLLIDGGPTILPPESTVIEILESVEPTPEIIRACEALRRRNYKLALDDFQEWERPHPLASVVDILKVDFRATTQHQREAIADRYRKTHQLLAEKVESEEEFQLGKQLGFGTFQGYFFSKPILSFTREIPGFKLNYFHILKEIQRPEPDLEEITELIKREPSISYKLLRFVNSALFGRRKRIKSLEQAVHFIGENELRKWLSIITTMELAKDKPLEVTVNALVRARFGELIALISDFRSRSSDVFLLGIVSRLDSMLGRPLQELLPVLNLEHDLQEALLAPVGSNGKNIAGLWSAVLAYEAADWSRAADLLNQNEIGTVNAPRLYQAAVSWADSVFQA
jgi:c-di-GMP-related signal transduction protein